MTTATPVLSHAAMKLGKLAPKHDSRTLQMADYLDLATLLPKVPHQCGWQGNLVNWEMDGNDVYGDCTCAAVEHMIRTWMQANGIATDGLTTADVLALYTAVTGFNPNDPSTDQGAYEVDVLNYWRKTGIKGHRISAYAAVNPKHTAMVKASVWLFGGLYVGAGLPISAQTQDIWTVAKGPSAKFGSWGGHAFPIVAYSPSYLWCVTWGQLKAMTWAWFHKYVDESYGVLGPEWTDGSKPAPSGFDLAALTADLQAVTA